MSDYRPPLRDIGFVLEHIVGLDELATLPGFEHVTSEDVNDALSEAGRFISEVVAPTNVIGDTEPAVRNPDGSVTVPDEMVAAYKQLVASGWPAIKGDTDYGGHGYPGVMATAIHEMLTAANMAFSLCPMLTTSAVEAFQHHGSDELKAAYLEKLTSGEWSGTMALTEPEAGSDVGALRAKAWPEDDGTWRLAGTKIFITWGEHEMADNIIHFVLARTPGAPPGIKGISLFLVPKYLVNPDGSLGPKNDVECVGIEHKLGIHASPTCVMAYGEQRGAVAHLVGEVNAGMNCMFTMMNDARLHVGLEGLGLSVRAYQLALDYASERRQGRAIGTPPDQTSPIIEHPDVRRMLMTMKANIEAMRALVFATSAAGDRSSHAGDEDQRRAATQLAALLTPIAKAWATDLGVELTSLGIQIHGGMGFVEETGAAQHWRDSRIAPIYEGTNGIQAIDLVMRKIPLGEGSVVENLLAEMEATSKDLAAAGHDLAPLGDTLHMAVSELRTTTGWLRNASRADVLAGATPYLRQFGVVAGGHYMARLALAASRQLEAADDPWLRAKIDTARFYISQILPQGAANVGAVSAGVGQLFAIPEDYLD